MSAAWIVLIATSALFAAREANAVECYSGDQCVGSGWYIWGDYHYAVFCSQKQVTWYEAERECIKYGAHLASSHSYQENAVLRGLAALASGQEYRSVRTPPTWIGLYKDSWGNWKWSDNTELVLQMWNDWNGLEFRQGCVFMNTISNWDNQECANSWSVKYYACKKPKSIETSEPPPPESPSSPPERHSSSEEHDWSPPGCDWSPPECDWSPPERSLTTTKKPVEVEKLSTTKKPVEVEKLSTTKKPVEMEKL
ncbi:hypothetical protein Y032_0015g2557 [Ancylostoma ceylanicum]|uniref:C-type lectin domain-containing protein n=1 Tax=Ancylostoma ceylanicum TaxID=53326 RepID=A0A016V6G0_9BILA|nr:hypothetical protein Y032_0015g2557 [Ancylostoma ceylanicum]